MPIAEVQPGGLIRADTMNELIRKVNELAAAPGGGEPMPPVLVPNVFGRRVTDARALLSAPGVQLAIGMVVDTAGAKVNLFEQANQARLVIGQQPPAGTRVSLASSVDLLIAVAAGGGPSPTPGPRADSLWKDGGQITAAAIASSFEIHGANFELLASANKVTFRAPGGDVTVDAHSSTGVMLLVVVPASIPGAPTTGHELEVQVFVETPLGTSAPVPLKILPPPAQASPVIGGSNAAFVTAGSSVTFSGSGFGTDPAAVRVFFDGEPSAGVTPSSPISDPSMTVTVPTTLPQLALIGAGQTFVSDVTAKVNGRATEVPFKQTIRKPPAI